MIRKTAWLAGAAAWLAAAPAQAVDGRSLELGYNHDVSLVRLALQWDWERRWSAGRTWEIGGYWEASAGAWRNGIGTIYDFGITPVFRLQRRAPSWPSPYLEAAIGVHMLSDLRISDGRLFSTKFQFGDHLGAGVRFGRDGRYDLSVRVQHLSNAGIRHPNPGINFVQVRLQYHLP